MPFYEYECSACQHYVEVLQKISDPPLRDCPNCGKAELTKLVSAPVFRLKGSGWYETDFKSEGENKRNLVESGPSPVATASAASKSEAATASATPAKAPADKPAPAPEKKAPAKPAPEKKAPAKESPAKQAKPAG